MQKHSTDERHYSIPDFGREGYHSRIAWILMSGVKSRPIYRYYIKQGVEPLNTPVHNTPVHNRLDVPHLSTKQLRAFGISSVWMNINNKIHWYTSLVYSRSIDMMIPKLVEV